MFCVNKVSKKFSTTGGESKLDRGLFNRKEEIVEEKRKEKQSFFIRVYQ